jgi:hypothetical protein
MKYRIAFRLRLMLRKLIKITLLGYEITAQMPPQSFGVLEFRKNEDAAQSALAHWLISTLANCAQLVANESIFFCSSIYLL